MQKRKRELMEMAAQAGLDVLDCEIAGSGHYRMSVRLPNGVRRNVIAPFSPSDGRSKKNTLSYLRKLARGGHDATA